MLKIETENGKETEYVKDRVTDAGSADMITYRGSEQRPETETSFKIKEIGHLGLMSTKRQINRALVRE